MSGGSFNYLFLAPGNHTLGSHRTELRELIERLDALACKEPQGSPLADALALVAYRSRVVERHLSMADTKATALEDVWHAVEWYVDADWGREQMAEVLLKYAEGERRGAGT